MKYLKLWLLVILFAGADVGTTIYGLSNGESEGNPVVQDAIDEVGVVPALISIKLGAVALGAGLYNAVPDHKWMVPTALLSVWAPVVVWNSWILFA